MTAPDHYPAFQQSFPASEFPSFLYLRGVATEEQDDSKVEIAHVLMMDVVQYSTLLITEQTRVMSELARIVRSTSRFQRAEAAGKLIRLPTATDCSWSF
jgi:hypothetical protein